MGPEICEKVGRLETRLARGGGALGRTPPPPLPTRRRALVEEELTKAVRKRVAGGVEKNWSGAHAPAEGGRRSQGPRAGPSHGLAWPGGMHGASWFIGGQHTGKKYEEEGRTKEGEGAYRGERFRENRWVAGLRVSGKFGKSREVGSRGGRCTCRTARHEGGEAQAVRRPGAAPLAIGCPAGAGQ